MQFQNIVFFVKTNPWLFATPSLFIRRTVLGISAEPPCPFTNVLPIMGEDDIGLQ